MRRLGWSGALVAYVAALAVAALTMLALLVITGHEVGNLWAVVALAGVAAIAERGSVKISSAFEESISLLPTLFAAVLFGPLAAMAVAAASMFGTPRPYSRWIVYTCSRSVTGAVAGFAFLASDTLVATEVAAIAVGTAAAAVVAEALDVAFGALMFRLRGYGRMRDLVTTHATVAFASVALYTAVVALLALAYTQVSPWTLPFFLVPAIAAQRLFVLYQEQRRLTADVVVANERLERANLSFATALVATLDARDRYTAGHSAAVAIYARDIASRMGLPDHEQQRAHLCGLVHDIGKIGLPPGLLEKPGALTLEERRQMEEHAAIGERILAKVDDYSEIASVVRHHHERFDGQGYPDGLSGDGIPLLARIIAVADAYNAMTSDRPYRDAMPSRVARLRLAQAVETQFDTAVVAAFEAILAGATETYRSGERPDFSLEAQDVYAHPVAVA